MDLSQFVLVTSNKNKLKEFQRFGIPNLKMESVDDIPEVQANDITVATYKAKHIGINKIVEDTSLDISKANVGSNVKWMIDNIHLYSGANACMKVLLSVNDGEMISLYRGTIDGVITKKAVNIDSDYPVFGFDANFIPLNSELTLYELELQNKKDLFSARKLAVENLIHNRPFYTIPLSEIPEWTGSYQ
jgi:inosine/xanthosine triphosphate pyrophosphatase family protein